MRIAAKGVFASSMKLYTGIRKIENIRSHLTLNRLHIQYLLHCVNPPWYFWKLSTFALLFACALAGGGDLYASTALSKDTVEPTLDIIVGHTMDGGSYTRVFDPDSSTNPGADRGQTFMTPEVAGEGTTLTVGEITLVADEDRDLSGFPNAKLTLWVFEWNGADANDLTAWLGGDGANDPEGSFDGTGVSTFLVDGDEIAVNLNISAGDFLHFQFSPALVLSENSAYGFLLSFNDGDGAAGENIQIQQSRDTADPPGEAFPDGTVLAPQPTTQSNSAQVNDDLRFYVAGTAGPVVEEDSDHDGLLDAWEIQYFGDLSQNSDGNPDNDGLDNLAEADAGTDPSNPDTDGDGLVDGVETDTGIFVNPDDTGTNPLNPDTDGDALRDGIETNTGVYASLSDTGTNPHLSDTDGDGTPDHLEISKGLDPNDPSSKLDRPNILFILTDDLGWGDLGLFYQNSITGTKKHATPKMDTIATAGMQFRNHYCPAPVCAPSRASFLLGVHQGHANVRDNSFDKALEDNHTVASTLRTAGYSTALIGKYGLQGKTGGSPDTWPAYPTKRGFDYFFGYVRHGDGHTHYPAHVTDSRGMKELYDQDQMIRDDLTKCYTADLFTARAKKRIIDETTDNPNKPFFIFLAYDTPHAALQLPTQAYPTGGGLTGGLQWIGTPGNMIDTASGTIDSFRHPDYADKGWSDVDERFANSVRRIDDCVGDLVKTLEDLGIDDNTLVVFTSDNGPHNESYLSANYDSNAFDSFGPFDGTKRDTWEGGIREPSWVHWPGTVSAGQVNKISSQFQDWMPTFVELAGYPAPSRTDGVSLVPTLRGSGGQKDSLVYIEYKQTGKTNSFEEFDPSHRGRRRNEMQVIFLEGYKGVRYDIAAHDDDFEIYDVESDPKEIVNFAGTSPEFDDLQRRMKNKVLSVRRVDPAYNRPYDSENVSSVTATVIQGVKYSAYQGLWPWIPEFTDLTPEESGLVNSFDLSKLTRPDNAGLLFTGYIRIPADGTWNFHLTSDSGAHLRIHESQVIDDDFAHTGAEVSGSVNLQAGLHPFRLYYMTDGGADPALDLKWSGPGIDKQTVPDATLFRGLVEGETAKATSHWILY